MTITRHNVGPRLSQAVVHDKTVYLAGQVAAGSPSVKGQTEESGDRLPDQHGELR